MVTKKRVMVEHGKRLQTKSSSASAISVRGALTILTVGQYLPSKDHCQAPASYSANCLP